MKTGIELIAKERKRQIEAEGWTIKCDKRWKDGELSIAAACYAINKIDKVAVIERDNPNENAWPWGPEWDNWDKRDKHDRKRSLIIAGALIAAELDRIICSEVKYANNM